jgi:hypothetical protein
MEGEMRHSQPPAPAGSPTEPALPACRIIFDRLLEPEEITEIDPERLQEMNNSAAIQTETVCKNCIENPNLGLVPPGLCPAKDIPSAEVAIQSLRSPHNRAYRRRLQHILTNQNRTIHIPGLDDETKYAIKGLQPEPKEYTTEDEQPDEEPVAPQALTDLRRGVEHEVLKDLGY